MSHFAKDFPKTVRLALAKKGITIVGACPIPDMTSDMPWANASRGYELNDNGTHRIRSYEQVKEMAV